MKNKTFKEKLDKGKKEFKQKHYLIKPIFLVTLFILIQIVLVVYIYNRFTQSIDIFNWFWILLRIVLIIYIINLDQAIEYRLAWILPIATLPLFGALLYLFLEIMPGPKQLKRKLKNIKSKNMYKLVQNPDVHKEIVEDKKFDYGLEKYLYEIVGYPIYKNNKLQYFSLGEQYFESLLEDIKKAEHFIFIEFFIIHEGYMLNAILEELEKKVAQGVEVRFMYDGTNDYHLPSDYKSYLESKGIMVSVFAPVLPILSTYHNNRDHRKIVSIDNKIAYTGGINLADEYINKEERFGHWKDSGIRIEGEAVRSFTVMFLNLWELSNGKKYDIDSYLKYKSEINEKGYIQPFDDSPNDNETVGENAYVDILNQAKKYVYIMTPYLILSESVKSALIFASKRGIDVRIMMPGIPDKKIPYNMGRSYYEQLIKYGIKIYEYTPGFLHSKTFVSDDYISVVGTINLDFRSLHLHYENATLIFNHEFAQNVKDDFLSTINKCREMDLETYKELNIFYRLIGKVLRIFAPLI